MPPINDYDDDRHKREELARRERRKVSSEIYGYEIQQLNVCWTIK